jgi:hypothetical protein
MQPLQVKAENSVNTGKSKLNLKYSSGNSLSKHPQINNTMLKALTVNTKE